MRLKSVTISEYKNLKDFSINFDENSFLEVFVGKNGCGKSNFFEALIEIFRHIYELDKDEPFYDFNYSITYSVDNKDITIAVENGVFKINNRKRVSVGQTPIPDNVLIYYSGHNDKVGELVDSYENKFKSKIKGANFDDIRRFVGIGPELKEILLSVLLVQQDGNKAKDYICQKLGISELGEELKLVLTRPEYAKTDAYDMEYPRPEEHERGERYWKPEGITKEFLDRLSKCLSTAEGDVVRTEGYLAGDDKYQLYFKIEDIQNEFDDYSSQDLFRMFDNLKTLGMLDEISVPLTLAGGQKANVMYFSDGQFQSIYIYSIVELFKDRNCIALFDEPDSFLHPEWQFDFLKQVFDITDTATQSIHVLMSSHSAVTLIPHDNKKIKFFDIKDNKVNSYDLPKVIAIKNLSSDLIKYSEQDQLLSIINTIQIEKKPVLFTEGSTDPIILKEAWYKLYNDEIPFIPFYAFSCTYINQLLTDDRIHNEMGGLPLFALFDFDKAYDQWNGLNGNVLANDPMQGLIKKWANGESYALMLPIPDNDDIKRQVIKDPATNETFGGASSCEIEHIFYGQQTTQDFFVQEACPGGNKIAFKSDSDKTRFAKEMVPQLDAACFEVFRPIFEFIRATISA